MWIDQVRQWFQLSPLQLICLTAFGEARGEGSEGMQAVINVIHNRRLHPIRRFGDASILAETRSPYHAIILNKRQFCIFNLGDPNRGRLLALSDPVQFEGEARNNRFLRDAVRLGELFRTIGLVDLTGGADHFFTIHIRRPDWTRAMIHRTTIKRHEFWSEPPHFFESPQRYQPAIDWVRPPQTPPEALPVVGGLLMARFL